MTITLKEFKKFAAENDILWFYNKPRWRKVPCLDDLEHYTKEQIDEYRKFYGESPLVVEIMTNKDLIVKNLVQNQIDINKKKEIQMNDKAREQKHAIIGNLTDSLDVAADNLERFVARVKGEPLTKKTEDKDGRDHGEKALALFLDEYPKRLDEINEKITVATNQLKELLF